jgi:hypothetical protein
MFVGWNPMKEEIEIWLTVQELEFSHKDNRSSRFKPRQYLERYVFSEIHESFFSEFPMLLQEWITWLKDTHPKNRVRSVEWTEESIARLKRVNNKFTCAVDFWLDNIVVGYITEFAVDTSKSYSVAEKEFLKGPRGRYIRSLYTSIKRLLHDKGVLTMESDN